MANELKTDRKAQAVSLLCEGIPPVESAETAVRVQIVKDAKGKK